MKYDLSKIIDLKTVNINELTEAADQDDPSALFMGYYIAEGEFGLIGHHLADSELLEWVKRGYQLRDTLCTARYAISLFNGRGIPRNIPEAKKIFMRVIEDMRGLAQSGSPYAQTLLALALTNGIPGKPRDAEARPLLEAAASQSEPVAQYYLGMIHERGFGVKANMVEAVRWYQLAAEQGHLYSQLQLADLYSRGQGVERDLGFAIQYYTKAARFKNAIACGRLGDLYLDPERSGGADVQRAVKWYLRGAQGDDNGSKLALAGLFIQGVKDEAGDVLVVQDMAAAFRYYAEVATDPVYAAKDPKRHAFADNRKKTMLIGTTRQTDGEGKKWIVFRDGTMALEIKPTGPGFKAKPLRNSYGGPRR
ncbi:MAG: tetratricopeptide repeat protein [Alphaproteobacteria bacterium]